MTFIILNYKGIYYKIEKNDTESFNQFYDRAWYFVKLKPTDLTYEKCIIDSFKWQYMNNLGYEY